MLTVANGCPQARALNAQLAWGSFFLDTLWCAWLGARTLCVTRNAVGYVRETRSRAIHPLFALVTSESQSTFLKPPLRGARWTSSEELWRAPPVASCDFKATSARRPPPTHRLPTAASSSSSSSRTSPYSRS